MDCARLHADTPKRRATADAISATQEQIRSGKLAPGERLPSERALSEALGVSRPTVREAVQSLAAMNILDVRHGTGIFVASLDLDELLRPLRFALELNEPTLDNLFEVRLALEPRAAELAAKRASDEQVAGIVECAAGLGRRAAGKEELLELDVELHRRIVEASGNELLINLIASLNVLSRRSRELTVGIPGVTRQTRKDHAGIVEAIARPQAEARARGDGEPPRERAHGPREGSLAPRSHRGLTSRWSGHYSESPDAGSDPLRIERG